MKRLSCAKDDDLTPGGSPLSALAKDAWGQVARHRGEDPHMGACADWDQLAELGLVRGAFVRVLQPACLKEGGRRRPAMIVQLRGQQLALATSLADEIWVEPTQGAGATR